MHPMNMLFDAAVLLWLLGFALAVMLWRGQSYLDWSVHLPERVVRWCVRKGWRYIGSAISFIWRMLKTAAEWLVLRLIERMRRW